MTDKEKKYVESLEQKILTLERKSEDLFRHPDISVCDNGHYFRTIGSHPAKNEREWMCPNCMNQTIHTLEIALQKARNIKPL